MLYNTDMSDFVRTDTIAAIATGMVPSGIGVIRISGPTAVPVADRVFRAADGKPLSERSSHTVTYGHIYDREEVVDEVMVSVFLAPRSYTGEDTVEISCHGGLFVMQKALKTVIKAGARLASPGEFTKRAFLSGRIDLTQSEAVMDLIASTNNNARKIALGHLPGRMKDAVLELREKLLKETAFIEAALDDPEHFELDGYGEDLSNTIAFVEEKIDELLSRSNDGKIMRDGITCAIMGRPNVGKSTLMNLLSGSDRAIVTDIPGTTRDVIEESVLLGDITLVLSDTAGLRDGSDEVESIGIERAKSTADAADLILYVIDGSQIKSAQDEKNLKEYAGRKLIVLVNKGDLKQQITKEEIKEMAGSAKVISFSAREGKGIDFLKDAVKELFYTGNTVGDELFVVNTRHIEALMFAKESLDRVKESIDNEMPEDLWTVDLMDAYAALGSIIGEEVSEDLINEIFSSFCMGK